MESVFFNVFLHVISPTSWIVLIPNRHFFPVCQMAEPTPRKSFDKGVNLEVLRLVFLYSYRGIQFPRCHVLFITVSFFNGTPIHLLKEKPWFLVGFSLVYCCLGVDIHILGLILREISDVSRYFPRMIWRHYRQQNGSTLVDCGEAPFF